MLTFAFTRDNGIVPHFGQNTRMLPNDLTQQRRLAKWQNFPGKGLT